ncbi:MAG: maleylpyruvate isomerase family mycothiol-dependent enzyme [Nocardioides sp.]|nr:maleylpyruvate isomerase family mycothiol-dependent enzyme [Nocardioides sp.]
MTTMETYVATWWSSVQDLLTLLEGLDGADWDKATDLPGWDVKAIASHVAHLEGITGGAPREEADVPEAPHIKSPMGQFTEIGVITRRGAAPEDIIDEIRRYTKVRHDELAANPPTDPDAAAEGLFGAIGWRTRTLLRNRPLDVWTHEQDIRRAVGKPGNLDSPGAVHTVDYQLEGGGYIVAKKAKAAPGTTVVFAVEGHEPRAFAVNDVGKGLPLAEAPESPDVRLAMDRETFTLHVGGRASADPSRITVTGDGLLAQQIIASMATAP